MTYDLASKELKRLSAKLRLTNDITTHSFRGGAATEAVAAGVDLDEIMRMGKWRSTEAFNAYMLRDSRTLKRAAASRFD